jgi:hypothetical protein
MGGLFLFVPDLVRVDGNDALARAAKLPGSRMIPAAHALRASLALKMGSTERKSHVMALVADEGLALFCGLNVMPKRSFLSEYSSRITPQQVSRLLSGWHAQSAGKDLFTGHSLNLVPGRVERIAAPAQRRLDAMGSEGSASPQNRARRAAGSPARIVVRLQQCAPSRWAPPCNFP